MTLGERTIGGDAHVTLRAAATTREAPLSVRAKAFNTVSVLPRVVAVPVFENEGYWVPVQERDERSLREALTRGGFSFDTTEIEGGDDPLVRTAVEYEALLDTGFRPAEVSEMLGVSTSEVLGRLADRTLYGRPTADGWKILGFQFEEDHPLPGLEGVLPLLHQDLHPVAVYRWFISPSVDLTVGDEQVSPRQWLLSGRSIAAVARIAIDL